MGLIETVTEGFRKMRGTSSLMPVPEIKVGDLVEIMLEYPSFAVIISAKEYMKQTGQKPSRDVGKGLEVCLDVQSICGQRYLTYPVRAIEPVGNDMVGINKALARWYDIGYLNVLFSASLAREDLLNLIKRHPEIGIKQWPSIYQ